jgi:beta-lactamase class C
VAACHCDKVADPQLGQALRMTQQEMYRVSEKFGQSMAWENVRLDNLEVVDKPGGLNNASAYIGLVPALKIGIVLLANNGNFPHEIARYSVLPKLARLHAP